MIDLDRGQSLARRSCPQGLGTRVAVIGCGGYLRDALQASFVEEVVCSDPGFFDPDAQDYFGPYVENCIQPYQGKKRIRLSDGRDTEQIVKDCELLFVTGSTLVNDTLLPLLRWAGEKPAIILEGNSAGLYPFPLFEMGVTHLVQTVVDVDCVALSHRFAAQKAGGHIEIPDASYLEILLPEMRTIQMVHGAPPNGERFSKL